MDDAPDAPASPDAPALTLAAAALRRTRLDREAAALRENLRRRKDQTRQRIHGDAASAGVTPASVVPAPEGDPPCR